MPNRANRDRTCPFKGNCKNCKFAFWNAGGLTEAKYIELKTIIRNNNIDAFAIVEAGSISDTNNLDKAEFEGYKIYNLPRSRQISTGMIIGVKVELTATFHIIHEMEENDKIEIAQLEVWNTHTKTKFIIIYNPPLNEPKNLDLVEVDESTILVGDFNAPNELWNYNTTSRVGSLIEEYVDSQPLILLEGTPTPLTFLAYGGSLSRPDLAFCHANLVSSMQQENAECPSGAGHKILLITRNNIERSQANTRISWNFKKAKWREFTLNTEEKFKAREKTNNVDTEHKEIVKILQEAAKKYIPRGKVPYYKPYWNGELQALKDERDKLRITIEESNDPDIRKNLTRQLNRTQARFARCITESKTRAFQQYAEKIDYRKDGSKAYTFFSKMNNKEKKETENNPILYKNKLLVEDKFKAEALGEHYAQQSNVRRLGRIKKQKTEYIEDNSDAYNALFLDHELNRALNKLKLKKSPGIDLIYPEFLKHLGIEGKQSLLHLCNLSWKGNIPDAWKKAEVIPVLKKGKDGTKVDSYRPIALISLLAKVMEHMVNFRLTSYLEENNILSPHQAGFRANRSTVDQIAYLMQDVKEGFNKHHQTLVVYIDFKSAFDLIDRNRLLEKMKEMKVPDNITRWTRIFMAQRMFRVKYKEKRSKYRQTRNGVQQGGVLSATYFIIYINDLAEYIKARCEVEVKLYADDVVIWYTGNDPKKMEQEMNKAMEALREWSEINGMVVNQSKTVYDYHTMRQTVPLFNINYGTNLLEKDDDAVYLGMSSDQKMTGCKQIDKMVSTSKRRLNLMKMVAGATWGANVEVLITTFITYIRPLLEYVSALLVTAPQSKLSTLDRVQNQAMRIATGAVRSTPIIALEARTNLHPLESRRNAASACLHEKLLRVEEQKWNREPYERLTTQTSFITKAQEIKSDLLAGIDIENRIELPQPNIRIAVLEVQHELSIDGISRQKKDYNEQVLRHTTLAHIHSRYPEKEWLHVYSDGSATPGQGNAGAGVYCREFEEAIPAGSNGSSYDGELRAILEALKKVRNHRLNKIVILSDSKAAIQAIASSEEVDREVKLCKIQLLKLKNENKEVVLQWVPSHCNLHGNEKADYLAKRGSKMPQFTKGLTYQSVKSHITTAVKKVVKKKWNDGSQNKPWQNIVTGGGKPPRYENRKVSSAQLRLDTGHDLLGVHLHKLGIVRSSVCSLCGKEEQNRSHLFRCDKTRGELQALPDSMTHKQKESCLYWITRRYMMAK
jgi:ribonuclease HI